jgi:hypothetical protein
MLNIKCISTGEGVVNCIILTDKRIKDIKAGVIHCEHNIISTLFRLCGSCIVLLHRNTCS